MTNRCRFAGLMPPLMLILAAGLLPAAAAAAAELSPSDKIKQGHSRHGDKFDEGPRAQPWEMMPGIGRTHFPITHKNPEVQKWFDQGNTLLHSFWEYEAERAFRWCLKLEPDNAMAWWGLARATSGDRSKEFIREAARRKDQVTGRERLYIEALEKRLINRNLRDRGDGDNDGDTGYKKALEAICVKYPDDIEARAMLALSNMGDARYGAELIIREILAKQPDHPGAHHYRIHNWNYHEPEQALASCRRFGEVAPESGHALHMPGHVYATVGMWHEAAISMDAATRVEKRYMKERLTFPFNNWNYGHNRNYLNYIQEQLGMAEAAMFGARQMIDAPLDPKHNSDNGYSTHSQGIASMLRTLVKYERWTELLDGKSIPWREIFSDKMNRAYAEAIAHFGLGDVDKAERAMEKHEALKKDLGEKDNKHSEEMYKIQETELKARRSLARGETIQGLALLGDAADRQADVQKGDNDPPRYPHVILNYLGRVYLEQRSPVLAARAFEKALELTRNDWFALAGLVIAYRESGEAAKASDAMARLLHVAGDADAKLAWLERARATGVTAAGGPRDVSPAPQRNYKATALDRFGPTVWEPYAAPALAAVDPDGKTVRLEDYRGAKNVILVFYLGKECLHCLKQLRDINAKKGEWERLETVVLAVSSNTADSNKQALKTIDAPAARILSDAKFENARRFRSYDDFEEMELHSTILIDKQGRVHWAHTGGEPFGDMAFLEKQLERMNK